jgi:iron complex outermembrane receptor protein
MVIVSKTNPSNGHIRRILGFASLLALSLGAAPSFAQTATPGGGQSTMAGSDNGGLEEIVVTARKREEALLDTPIAISAFSSERIQSEGIQSIDDVAKFTPSVTVNNSSSGASSDNRGFQSIIIRGMTPSLPSGSNNTTSVFIDGAPVSSGFIDSIGDLERVEVLKGPQSAQFGTQVFAGAVNLITKTPNLKEFQVKLDGLLGSNNWYDMRGTIEGPIVEDKIAFRVGVRGYATDGTWSNNASLGGTLGDQSTKSINGALYAALTDQLTVRLYGVYWNDDDGPNATAKINARYGEYNCKYPNATFGSYYCGTLPLIPASQLSQNPQVDSLFRSVILNNSLGLFPHLFDAFLDHGGMERYGLSAHAQIDYDFENQGFTVTLLSAGNQDHFQIIEDLNNQDAANFPNPLHAFIPYTESTLSLTTLTEQLEDDVSQEVRVTSDGEGPFKWSFGGNFAHYISALNAEGIAYFGPALFGNYGAPSYTDSYSAFFSTSYDLPYDVNLSFDGRYLMNHVAQFNETVKQVQSLGATGNFRNFLPRVILSEKLTPDWLLYASWSKGANPGTFNASLLPGGSFTAAQIAYLKNNYGGNIAVLPEHYDSYEIGSKAKFWGGKAELSADIYYGLWSNQIVSENVLLPASLGNNLTGLAFNNGRTELYGFETEGSVRPVQHITLTGGFAYNDSKIEQGFYTAGIQSVGTIGQRGKHLPYYSLVNGNLTIRYSDQFTDELGWYVAVEDIYKSGLYDQTNSAKTPDNDLVNLRAGLKASDWSLEGFILNVTNQEYYTSVQQNVDSLAPAFVGNNTVVGLGPKIQFGVRGSYKFDAGHDTPAQAAAYTPPPVVAPKPASTARSYQVFFDFNKSDLTPQAVTIVDTAAKNAGPAKVTEIEVTGHTDTVGSDAYNMRLSRRRAESVAAELEKMGIPSSEIAIFAKGKKDLLVPTADGVKEPQNRRVQIVYAGGPTS